MSPESPTDLAEAVTGDLRPALEALRDHLAAEMAEGVACKVCGGSVSSPTAPLAKQLRDTLNQLAALAKPEGSKTDELKANRVRRQARVAKRAGGSQQHGARGGRARS